MLESEEEKKNKRTALISTIGITGLVLLLLFIIIAWRAPDPPAEEYGIELNFGTDQQGSGEIQPREPVGTANTKAEEQSAKEETQPSKTQETQEEVKETSKPAETVPEPVVSKEDNSVPVKSENKKTTPQPEKSNEKAPAKTEQKVEPQINKQQEYKPNATSSGGKTGKTGSQGDDANKAGDKGSPEGKLDATQQYGKAGGGSGGASLSLNGWDWDKIPEPKIPTGEPSGRIRIEILVDENGELISYKVLERGLSPAAEQACKLALQGLTFTKDPGAKVASVTKGEITFVAVSR